VEKDYELPEPHVLDLEREVFSWIGEVWPFEEERGGWGSLPGHPRFITKGLYTGDNGSERLDPGWLMLREPDHPLRGPMLESLRRLQARYGERELSVAAADLIFGQSRCRDYWYARQRENWHGDRQAVLFRIANTILAESPPPDIYERIGGGTGASNRNLSGVSALLLLALPSSPENRELAEEVVRQASSYWEQVNLFPGLIERLFEAGRFEYEDFLSVVRDSPNLLNAVCDEDGAFYSGAGTRFNTGVSTEFKEAMLGYCRRLAGELAKNPKDAEQQRLVAYMRLLRGDAELLVTAATLHSAYMADEPVRGVSVSESYSHYYPFEDQDARHCCVVNLARAADGRSARGERRQRIVGALREGFSGETLERLLPFARFSRSLLTEALGWDEVLPLVEAVAVTLRKTQADARIGPIGRDPVCYCPDPENGVLEVGRLRDALDTAGEHRSREAMRIFRESMWSDRTIRLIEAVAGWNREWVEKRLEKRNQDAVKAYGLLPVEHGEEEVLERYVFLKRFERESKQFGSQRRSNESAAARAALTNLARNAGYADATRLEWAMEARAGGEAQEGPRTWRAEDYEVKLSLEGGAPRLVFRRGEKTLKSVPKAVRESEMYPEIRKSLADTREQVTRLRAALEDVMSQGELLSPEDLSGLAHLPAARMLLGALILLTEDGVFGLPEFDAGESGPPRLRSLDGAAFVVDGSVKVAHSYHLFRADALHDWQREIVRRRIVQPFKQAFRELYLLTPAERETRTHSIRFANYTVDSRVTSRLLSGRGWTFEQGGGEDETEPPYRTFRGKDGPLRATFGFAEIGRYFTEDDVMTDEVHFHSRPTGSPLYTPEPRLPLEEIPAVAFSEVMRDADLVVSVAHREDETRLSEEAYERRGDLIRTLLGDLGLPGVRVDGHFARVEGRQARYRVHMGSAAIHVEPDNHLCIVPERWGRRHKDLFLPFADEGDEKVSEVVSKVLMLTNDDKIKDQSILRQIRS